ncbi:hypothetical protein [Hydrogenophaga sp. PAMC20947]|uniref:hypothetical protein n=1 Tax=Hydrogenophaga sp. PAMC20947 TaxID=2565558 RepID=UPI00109E29BE|nr:hypothetical protein [Hydrogenophaga sp. PAMC20947]QCB47796.1 hypothetical protein E5678_18225 [Hydrogenophaga sp. PAMC20947]
MNPSQTCSLRPLPSLVAALIGTLLLFSGPAVANPHRLDDALSHTVPASAQMQWRAQTGAEPDAGVEAWVRVNVRIDTSDWVGRTGRVYMVLPRDQASSMEAEWTTNGTLRAGRLVSGERALVYAGRIAGSTLQDQIQVRLRSAPDWETSSRRLNFYFELDVDGADAPLAPTASTSAR